jgi:hypothetical protein
MNEQSQLHHAVGHDPKPCSNDKPTSGFWANRTSLPSQPECSERDGIRPCCDRRLLHGTLPVDPDAQPNAKSIVHSDTSAYGHPRSLQCQFQQAVRRHIWGDLVSLHG